VTDILDREGWSLHRKQKCCSCKPAPDALLMTEKQWVEKYKRGEVLIPAGDRQVNQ